MGAPWLTKAIFQLNSVSENRNFGENRFQPEFYRFSQKEFEYSELVCVQQGLEPLENMCAVPQEDVFFSQIAL